MSKQTIDHTSAPSAGQRGETVITAQDMVIRLQGELSAVTEQLAASTEARRLMADTIKDLRAQVESLQGARRVLLTLTDRGDEADGYCAYDEGMVWVRELEAAG